MNNQLFFSLYSLAHQSTFFDTVVVFTAEKLGYIVIVLAAVFLLFHHDVIRSKNPLSHSRRNGKKYFSHSFQGVSHGVYQKY